MERMINGHNHCNLEDLTSFFIQLFSCCFSHVKAYLQTNMENVLSKITLKFDLYVGHTQSSRLFGFSYVQTI